MAKIANVALTNTFDTWRSRSNEAFDRLSQFAINNSSLYANTLTSNTAFTAKGTATVTGLFTASGRATVGTNLTVSGNTTFGPNILGLVNIAGRAAIGTNLTVSGNTTLGAAGKTLTTTGAWSHTGWGSLTTNLTVSGNTTFGGAGKVSNTTGWFGVAGRATVSTNLFVGANTFVMNRLGIGTSTPVSILEASSASLAATLNATQDNTTMSFRTDSGNTDRLVFKATRFAAGSDWTYANLTLGREVAGTVGEYPRITFGNGTAGSFDPQLKLTSGAALIQLNNSGTITAGHSLTIPNRITAGNTTLGGTTTDNSNALAQTLTDGATINWDVSLGRVATVTLGAAGRTMAAPTNLKVGTYILRVYQDGTGSRTITSWNAVFKWTAAVAPVLSTGAGKLDIITFFSDGTNLYGSYLPDMR